MVALPPNNALDTSVGQCTSSARSRPAMSARLVQGNPMVSAPAVGAQLPPRSRAVYTGGRKRGRPEDITPRTGRTMGIPINTKRARTVTDTMPPNMFDLGPVSISKGSNRVLAHVRGTMGVEEAPVAPSRGEIIFLLTMDASMDDGSDRIVVEDEEAENDGVVPIELGTPVPGPWTIQTVDYPALNIASLNFLIANDMVARTMNAVRNNDRSFALSELARNPDIYRGRFAVDGIIKEERVRMGGESATSDGLGNGRLFGVAGYDPARTFTVVGAGRVFMNDIFGMHGVQPGASLWLVFRKFEIKDRERYVLSSKASHIQYIKYQENLDEDPMQIGVMAWQYAAVAWPPGTHLPSEYLAYTENGVRRYGVAVRIGRVLFPPRNKAPRACLTPAELTPLMDATLGAVQGDKDRITVLAEVQNVNLSF